MQQRTGIPIVPAAFFGIVLGLSGIGGAWRVAHQVWGLPSVIGETLMLCAATVWAVLIVLYAAKWIVARDEAVVELHHPIQCCFIGLIGVATMLVAGASLPYSRAVAEFLFAFGAAFTLCFAVWRTGGLWQGNRDPSTNTAVLYLPSVAGCFVTATMASYLGYPGWGQFVFGAGAFSWLAIESVLLHRFYTVASLPPALRPTLGIQLAPAPVGAVAYLSITNGPPDVLAHALVGYGILQALVLLRLWPWIKQAPFAPSYWGVTFGAGALPSGALRMIQHGDTGPITVIAPLLFVAANAVIALIALGTINLLVTRRFLQLPQSKST